MSAIEVAAGGSTTIRDLQVGFPEADLDDLRRRINATRWPERETVDDDSQGVPLATMQELARSCPSAQTPAPRDRYQTGINRRVTGVAVAQVSRTVDTGPALTHRAPGRQQPWARLRYGTRVGSPLQSR